MSVETQRRSAADWSQLARVAAEERSGEAPQLLCELLTIAAEDVYALPVERIREIVRVGPITPMPRVPEAVLGLVALRGEMVQVVDLRLRLGKQRMARHRSQRIVVLHGHEGQVAGLLVDAVREVLRVPEDDLVPPPAGEGDAVDALCHRGEDLVSLLDVDRVLELGHV